MGNGCSMPKELESYRDRLDVILKSVGKLYRIFGSPYDIHIVNVDLRPISDRDNDSDSEQLLSNHIEWNDRLINAAKKVSKHMYSDPTHIIERMMIDLEEKTGNVNTADLIEKVSDLIGTLIEINNVMYDIWKQPYSKIERFEVEEEPKVEEEPMESMVEEEPKVEEEPMESMVEEEPKVEEEPMKSKVEGEPKVEEEPMESKGSEGSKITVRLFFSFYGLSEDKSDIQKSIEEVFGPIKPEWYIVSECENETGFDVRIDIDEKIVSDQCKRLFDEHNCLTEIIYIRNDNSGLIYNKPGPDFEFCEEKFDDFINMGIFLVDDYFESVQNLETIKIMIQSQEPSLVRFFDDRFPACMLFDQNPDNVKRKALHKALGTIIDIPLTVDYLMWLFDSSDDSSVKIQDTELLDELFDNTGALMELISTDPSYNPDFGGMRIVQEFMDKAFIYDRARKLVKCFQDVVEKYSDSNRRQDGYNFCPPYWIGDMYVPTGSDIEHTVGKFSEYTVGPYIPKIIVEEYLKGRDNVGI